MEEIIDVVCIVLPDGTVHWTDNLEHAKTIPSKWLDQHPMYENLGTTCGWVSIRMPKSDYKKIPIDGRFL